MSKAIGSVFSTGYFGDEDDEEKDKFQTELNTYVGTAKAVDMENPYSPNGYLNMIKNVYDDNSYPVVRDDKRSIFNSAVERFVKSNQDSNNDSITAQVLGAASDLGENYINMINANLQSNQSMKDAGTTIDNYYHCVGNYDAAKRGNVGSATAATIGLGREAADYMKNIISKKSFSDANEDFWNDISVNNDGRMMAQSKEYNSAFEACEKYRPEEYDPLERWKYYRNRYRRNQYKK